MLIPVRCFTCGKPVSAVWEKYKERIERGEQPGKVLDDLGMDRYCCRSLLLTHRDVIKKIGKFRV
ncbi:MAG: DNA-directed RNA polymerase subunit N [archaeon GW2011_AR5]|nr:MAG: DNA-directed RNA polymerase subunit N [archaeon GW2011_AR5]